MDFNMANQILQTPQRPLPEMRSLRRSAANFQRPSLAGPLPINDEEERREARHRTLLSSAGSAEINIREENEIFDKCLEVCHNKLNRDNAWNVSLIDMVGKLLERHNSKLKNLTIAGSTLEASCKVYGMRVDSLHTDVMRMTAGLGSKESSEQQRQDGDNEGDGSQDAGGSQEMRGGEGKKRGERRRIRKAVSTVTKNRETLNGRLETVPPVDAIFAKLNSTLSSINASNRLLNNILPTKNSELLLECELPSWRIPYPEKKDYTEVQLPQNDKTFDCTRLVNVNFENYQLRPMLTGYVISDTPLKFDDKDGDYDKMPPPPPSPPIDATDARGESDAGELGVAFNMNVDYEAEVPCDNDMQADVDYEDLGELTAEDHQAINNCRNLRVPRVYVEDMRPTDSSLNLEYSYRPLDTRISLFWAGPSHWKFKQPRLSQNKNRASTQLVAQQRARTNKRSHLIEFREQELHDDVFLGLDKYKPRKTNMLRKCDPKKLKLPSDLKLDMDMFNKFQMAPGIPVVMDIDTQSISTNAATEEEKGAEDEEEEAEAPDFDPIENHFGEDYIPETQDACLEIPSIGHDQSLTPLNASHDIRYEIATSFEGAPETVNKIVIPFAKRAKVIDMKNLKRSCHKVIDNKLSKLSNLSNNSNETEVMPEKDLPAAKGEIYAPGAVKLSEVMTEMPGLLTPAMQSSVSFTIALYGVLHVASENNLHLFSNEDHTDAKIRRVVGFNRDNNNNNDKN